MTNTQTKHDCYSYTPVLEDPRTSWSQEHATKEIGYSCVLGGRAGFGRKLRRLCSSSEKFEPWEPADMGPMSLWAWAMGPGQGPAQWAQATGTGRAPGPFPIVANSSPKLSQQATPTALFGIHYESTYHDINPF